MNAKKGLVLSWGNVLVVVYNARDVQFIILAFAMSVILDIICDQRKQPAFSVKHNAKSVMNLVV